MSNCLSGFTTPSGRLRLLFFEPVTEFIRGHVDQVVEFPKGQLAGIRAETEGQCTR